VDGPAVAVVLGEALTLSRGVDEARGLPGLLDELERMRVEGALTDALPGAVALDLRGDTLGRQRCGARRDRLLGDVGGLLTGRQLGTGVRDPRLRRGGLALRQSRDGLVVALDRTQERVVLGGRHATTVGPSCGHRVSLRLLERGVGVACLQARELLAVACHLACLLGPGARTGAANPHTGQSRLLRLGRLDEMRSQRLGLELGRDELLVGACGLLHLAGVVVLQRIGDQPLRLVVAGEHLALQLGRRGLDLVEVLREVGTVGGGDALSDEVGRGGRLLAEHLLGLLLHLMGVAAGLQLRLRRVLSDGTLDVVRGRLRRVLLAPHLDLLVGDLHGLGGDVTAVLAADLTLGAGDLQRRALRRPAAFTSLPSAPERITRPAV
jgi:hypothetical protein